MNIFLLKNCEHLSVTKGLHSDRKGVNNDWRFINVCQLRQLTVIGHREWRTTGPDTLGGGCYHYKSTHCRLDVIIISSLVFLPVFRDTLLYFHTSKYQMISFMKLLHRCKQNFFQNGDRSVWGRCY